MEATHFNSMATGLNMFSLVEELSSPAFRKIAALVAPKRGYPELPDYPTIPALPIYSNSVTSSSPLYLIQYQCVTSSSLLYLTQ